MDILCIGILVADIIVKPIDSIDYTVDVKKVDNIEIKNGGDCLNTAIVLSKLGNELEFIGKVGDDLLGRFLIDTAKQYGMQTNGIIVDPKGSTSSVIVPLNSQNEHVYLYNGGTNDTLCIDDIDLSHIDDSKIVHIGGTFAMPAFDGMGAAKLLEHAQSKGKLTTMDVTWDTSGKWYPTIQPCLPFLDYFMPSINEARMICGTTDPVAIAAFLQNQGVRNVIVKLGEKGCYIKQADTEGYYVPAFRVDAIDTSGAGDSFVAGFLTGLNKGWEVQECARFASAVSALCVQQIGATAGAVTFDEVIDFMKSKSI